MARYLRRLASRGSVHLIENLHHPYQQRSSSSFQLQHKHHILNWYLSLHLLLVYPGFISENRAPDSPTRDLKGSHKRQRFFVWRLFCFIQGFRPSGSSTPSKSRIVLLSKSHACKGELPLLVSFYQADESAEQANLVFKFNSAQAPKHLYNITVASVSGSASALSTKTHSDQGSHVVDDGQAC